MAEETLYAPIRAYNRSQGVRIEKQRITSTATTIVNLGNPVTHKEFTYHSAIGAVYLTGPITSSLYVTLYGLGVTVKEGEAKEIVVAAGEIRHRSPLELIPVAKKELAITKTTTNPRIDNVVIKLSTGVASIQKGIAAAEPVAPAVEEGYIAIATLSLPKEKEEAKAEYITSLRVYL